MKALPSQSCASSGTQLMMQQYREDYHMWAGRLPTWRHAERKVNNFPTPKWWHLILKCNLLFLTHPVSWSGASQCTCPLSLPKPMLSKPNNMPSKDPCVIICPFATFLTLQIQTLSFKDPECFDKPFYQLLDLIRKLGKGVLDDTLCKAAVLFPFLFSWLCITASYALTFYNLCLHSIGLMQDTETTFSHRKIILDEKFEGWEGRKIPLATNIQSETLSSIPPPTPIKNNTYVFNRRTMRSVHLHLCSPQPSVRSAAAQNIPEFSTH